MQKMISLSIVKPMVPVIKSKYNTKLERAAKEYMEKENASVGLFKKPITLDQAKDYARREMGFSCELHFIRELEVCVKNPGDLILEARDVELLNRLYEAEI